MNGLENLLRQISDKLDAIAEGVQPKAQTCAYTLFEWIDEWFVTYRVPVLKDQGYDLHNSINKHVKPHIENKPLNEYTAHDIAKALCEVRFERMRQITRQIYDQAFREAVRAGYIERNPVDNVDSIKHVYINGHAMTIAEHNEFLEKIVGDKHSNLYRFYLLTGARPSEPLTVTWQHVGSDTIRIPGTKTELSDRVLPISKDLRALLDAIPHTGERLFPYSYQTVLKHFNKYILPRLSFKITLKDFRHTFATRCAESGVIMRTLQKWMGHSRLETTVNNQYGHTKINQYNRSGYIQCNT